METTTTATDIICGFPDATDICIGCGETLLIENAWMADGCPCNSPLGINSMNETRWRLLMKLQQQQSRQVEEATKQSAPPAPAMTLAAPKQDGYYWLELAPTSLEQLVQVCTGRSWSKFPTNERKRFVMFVGMADRVVLDELAAQYPDLRWGPRIGAIQPLPKPAPVAAKTEGEKIADALVQVSNGNLNVACGEDAVIVASGGSAQFIAPTMRAAIARAIDAALAARDAAHQTAIVGLIDAACDWYTNDQADVSCRSLRNKLESLTPSAE